MTKSSSKKSSKKHKNAQQSEGHSPKHSPRSNPADPRGKLLFLQHAAGNQAVSQSLQSDAKITVSQPGDVHEREADRKAHDAVRKPGSKQTRRTPSQKRTPPSSDSPIQKAGSQAQPLPESERAFFESRLGQELGDVRIHTDAQAAKQAGQLDARAFTLGQDIVFGAGQYAPHTDEGKRLLAHELAHVVQQENISSGEAGGATGNTTIMRAPKLGKQEELAEQVSLSESKIPKPQVIRTAHGIAATVYFGQDSFLLESANFKAVEQLSEELRFFLEPTVTVDGHASTEGTDPYNLELSEKRRQAVIAILKVKAKDKVTFSGTAYGETKPAVEETAKPGADLEQQRARNRRVEIMILPSTRFGLRKPPERKKRLDLSLPPPKPETLEERVERIIREPPPPPRPKRSLGEVVGKKFDEAVDDILRKAGVKRKYRGMIKKGARTLAEKGIDTLLDKALDQTGLDDNAKEKIRDAIKGEVERFEF
jgi:outer membrane protein OmpA-like peptidoglycan-associated protein